MKVTVPVVWRLQVVGTGVLADCMPLDLGTVTTHLESDGSLKVSGSELGDRLTLAAAAFAAVMNAPL